MKKIRLFAAALALPFFTACSEEAPPVEANTGPKSGPSHMTMPESFPLTEIAGMQFAVCGGRCEELITEDPEKYREFAVDE